MVLLKLCMVIGLYYVSVECRRSSLRRLSSKRKPNIILLITDDQDVELGSMDYMPKVVRVLREGGAEFLNGFVTTPLCCPSRSSILTGLYVHNHNVYSNGVNCSGSEWRDVFEPNTFAVHLWNHGYRTGYFGKYLNDYEGNYIPPGWRHWVGLQRNSRYYNYTLNVNGRLVRHGDRYERDYLTDLIANDSLAFFKRSKRLLPEVPVLMVLSFPAPHGPEDVAPHYKAGFFNETSHRNPAWNYAPNPDKTWLLRHTGKMQPLHVAFTDLLHRRRLQTLQSVDDAVQKLYNELRDLGELSKTYIIFTSDHGYHLGQYGLIKGKSMPYEFDLKVPFFIRGPKIAKGLKVWEPALNIDIAPTIMELAGLTPLIDMDGQSVLPLLGGRAVDPRAGTRPFYHSGSAMWRDTFLVERGVNTKQLTKLRERLERQKFRYSKLQRIEEECKKPHNSAPCKPFQQWECRRASNARWRIFKCRGTVNVSTKCSCYPSKGNVKGANSSGVKRLKRSGETLPSHTIDTEMELSDFERLENGFSGEVSQEQLDLWEEKFFQQLVQAEIVKSGWTQGIFDEVETTDDYSKPFETKTRSHHDAGNVLVWRGRIHRCSEVDRGTFRCRKRGFSSSRLIRPFKGKPNLTGLIQHIKRRWHTPENIDSDSKRGRLDKEGLCVCDNGESGLGSPKESSVSHPLKEKLSLRKIKVIQSSSPRKKLKWGKKGSRKRHRKHGRRKRKKSAKKLYCNVPNMHCFLHSDSHWKTAPFWRLGPFCFCQNSQNSSYHCLRTVNETHNFLYCEFVTGFVSYYDIRTDYYQLHNIVYQIKTSVLEQLSHILDSLKKCKGRDCNLH